MNRIVIQRAIQRAMKLLCVALCCSCSALQCVAARCSDSRASERFYSRASLANQLTNQLNSDPATYKASQQANVYCTVLQLQCAEVAACCSCSVLQLQCVAACQRAIQRAIALACLTYKQIASISHIASHLMQHIFFFFIVLGFVWKKKEANDDPKKKNCAALSHIAEQRASMSHM